MRKDGMKEDAVDVIYPFYAVVYVLRGQGTYTSADGSSHAVGPGTVFQRNTEEKHSLTIDPESGWAECFVGLATAQAGAGQEEILRSGRWRGLDRAEARGFCEMLRRLGVIEPSAAPFDVGLRYQTMAAIDGVLGRMKTCAMEQLGLLQADLLAIVNGLWRRRVAVGEETDDMLERALLLLQSDLACHDAVSELLEELPISYSRLRELFREKRGISPAAYRNRCRIEHACTRLLMGVTPTRLAEELGYRDYAAFSNGFKLITGISPRAFLSRR